MAEEKTLDMQGVMEDAVERVVEGGEPGVAAGVLPALVFFARLSYNRKVFRFLLRSPSPSGGKR